MTDMGNALILDGKSLADDLAHQLALQIRANGSSRAPKLHIYRDLGNPSPFAFALVSRAKAIGIDAEVMGINHIGMTNEQMLYLSNRDDGVDGIMVIDDGSARGLIGRISPPKDVDHYQDDSPYRPAVSMAVMHLLHSYGHETEGCNAAVIGRSRNVGLPIALDLLGKGATVTICHTGTRDIREVVHSSDLVVSCTGVKNLIHPLYVKPGAWVIDTGCDVARGSERLAGAITPRTGGLGPLTVVCALANVVSAWADRFMWEVDTHKR